MKGESKAKVGSPIILVITRDVLIGAIFLRFYSFSWLPSELLEAPIKVGNIRSILKVK